jgi:hypothetical protein
VSVWNGEEKENTRSIVLCALCLLNVIVSVDNKRESSCSSWNEGSS